MRIDLEDDLEFDFVLVARQTTVAQVTSPTTPSSNVTVDTHISGLTFAYASNAKELDTLVTREFHSDPNLHRNSNVQLIGDLSTTGLSSIEHRWVWKWGPPKTLEDRGGGWRCSCSFLEYDSRAHRLNTLAAFTFWVHRTPTSNPMTYATAPQLELAVPQSRHRMPSSQSYQSAMSDSEGPYDAVMPHSPGAPAAEVPLPVPTSAPPLPPVDLARPAEDVSNFEDGPVFRANMKSLEQKSGNLRTQVKKVLRKAEAAQHAQAESNECIRAFLSTLQEAANHNASSLKPALEHYFSNTAKHILQYEDENSMLLRRQVIDPLSRLYTNDIKQVEAKKKDFEDESREYYAYVSRYLGQRQDSMKEKKRVESDSKYQTKKKNFELKRFDYSNFMQDLHGGRKEQELLAHLTKYADGQASAFLSASRRIERLQPQLDALIREVAEADKEYKMQRTEREEKRRNLEMNNQNASEARETATHVLPVQATSSQQNGENGYASDTDLSRADSTSSQFGAGRSNLSPSNSDSHRHAGTFMSTSPGTNRFRGIRDLEERDAASAATDKQSSACARKEGLVWALSKPGSHIDPKGINKQAWHKFWIVLDQGRLSEYSNWKDRMELHREPIDLRMASVRVARDADRRFCFEVITPHYKRVYQATGEEDMMSWIKTINNALQSAFEGRTNSANPSSTKSERSGSEFGVALTGKSLSQSGPHGTPGRSDVSGVSRRVTVGSKPVYTTPTAPVPEENPTKLLDQLRSNDGGNRSCADCGSISKVEWVSLNLGIVVCIECGGIHRSLGTHVSKIRSLTLDVHSFTDDMVELLMQIGNRLSNMIWEAKVDGSRKPEAWANREQRLKYITAKYVDRAFVDFSPAAAHFANPDEALLASIKRNDIHGVLASIAQRADVNVHDKSRNTHAVYLALVAADPARPSSAVSSSLSGSPASTRPPASTTQVFPIAELLIQNGSTVPLELPGIPLSPSAQQYIGQRLSGRHPQSDTLGPLPIMGTKEQAKLQKRGSAGSRFAGKVAGLAER